MWHSSFFAITCRHSIFLLERIVESPEHSDSGLFSFFLSKFCITDMVMKKTGMLALSEFVESKLSAIMKTGSQFSTVVNSEELIIPEFF
jgi:hypothetical protein